MKKIFLSGMMTFLVFSVFSQKNNTERQQAAEAATKVLAEKYNLTNLQRVKMLKIQTRKLKNIADFAELKNTDFEKYILKMSANEKQTKFSMRRMFNEKQVDILNKSERALRVKRAKVSSRMQKEGASRLEIQKALLEVE